MKLTKLLPYSSIPAPRKKYISSCIKSFNTKFPNNGSNSFAVTRNRIGLLGHFAVFLNLIPAFCKAVAAGNIAESCHFAFWAKVNFDFAIFVNNINKKKASVFSIFLKNRGVVDEKELEYGMKRFLINVGSLHYPILHPHKTKRLALNGEYKKSFETSFLFVRTDKKNIIDYLLKKFTRQN